MSKKKIGNGLCCWVFRPASPGVDAEYCGVPTNYRMVRDDDGNLHRKHETFCLEHLLKARVLKARDQEDE